MADNKPIFHHLNVCLHKPHSPSPLFTSSAILQNSQSQRILWLLEELNKEYNVVLHERNPPTHPTAPFRSPPLSSQPDPPAKHQSSSPVLKTGTATFPNQQLSPRISSEPSHTEDKFGLRNGDWICDLLALTSVDTLNSCLRDTLQLLVLNRCAH